jgi:hypothetical protein
MAQIETVVDIEVDKRRQALLIYGIPYNGVGASKRSLNQSRILKPSVHSADWKQFGLNRVLRL